MRSFLAAWRVSLHRTRADWPIVAAAWLVMLLAAVLLAAGPIYPSAAAEAGLRRALADAPAADTDIEVSGYVPVADAGTVGDLVQPELQQVIALGGSIVRDWRGAATLALPGLPGAAIDDQAIIGTLDGLPDHATLVDGAWPVDSGGPAEPIQVVVVDAVAQAMRLDVGDELSLVAHPSFGPLAVPVRLVGVFAVNEMTDSYWRGDEQLLAGITDNGQYRALGPFLTTPTDLLHRAGVASVHMQWRTVVDFDRVTVGDAERLRNRVEGLHGRLLFATGEDFYVASALSTILRDAERSLLVSRTGVLLLMAQLSILAAYAIVLTASLLVDHRLVDTALLRSRGAGALQVAGLALAEGLVLAIPAVLVAPWLAVAALNLLNVVGPLAEVGLRIAPHVTLDGYIAAGVAGLVCVGLLALPAVLAARTFAAEQGGISRQETRTFGQRMGLDLVLLVVTVIAIWQLRLYGAPLTRTVQGTLGLDPLLVAAPAIGLVAGGVLALRILPLLAHALEAAVSRGRSLVGSLGSRQLARRPLRYTRSALLLMLAVSMGVFGLSYSATWASSQRDQAAYQAGADVRVQPGASRGGLPGWSLPSAYADLAGVEAASAVERIADGVAFAAHGSVDLLALDAATAAEIVLIRADTSAAPLDELMATLRAGRPEPRLLALPDGTAFLRIVPRVDLSAVDLIEFDPATGEVRTVPLDPAGVEVGVSVNVIIRDGQGLLYRVDSELVTLADPTTAIVLPLTPTSERAAAAVARVGGRLAGPVTIAGLGLDTWAPANTQITGMVGLAAVAAGTTATGSWTDVPLTGVDGWRAKMAPGRRVLAEVPAGQVHGTAVELAGSGPEDFIFGAGGREPSVQLAFQPPATGVSDGPVPVIANRTFTAATGTRPGDVIAATVAGGTVALSIAGVVESFPTTDPAQPLLVLDMPTLGLLRLAATGSVRTADEWWMATSGATAEALVETLRQEPFESTRVVSERNRARTLATDPVALGIIGALMLGFVATGLFAIVGLTVSAGVSARQRRTEFALLRALGLSGRQLSGSLWLENGSVVIVSLVAGTFLGLVIAWMALPFVTVTQGAAAPVPPVLVNVPWDRILALDLTSAVALGGAVIVVGGVLRRLGVGSVLRMGED
ncbi:MAG: ABC transporter permease [Chloroflexota bacterium]|nr:MAG: ABC transporter permease [Chloroflexota bacterium]